MNASKLLLERLDVFVRKIAETSALVPKTGLMTGKMGIAILLYHYARYKNAPDMMEFTDQLIDSMMQETGLDYGKGLDGGLCGIAWGIDYLIKQQFVQAEEDIFEEIDACLFQEENRVLFLFDLDVEAEKGLYAWNRLTSCQSSEKHIWRQRMEKCVSRFHEIWMQRYTNYNLPVFPCRILIRFFHICQTLWEHNLYRSEIESLYEELPETVKISYREEPSFSDKHMLASLLTGIPVFEKCIPVDDVPQSMTLTDVSNFYLTRLVLGRDIPIPEIVDKTMLSIAEDRQKIDELLHQLKPDNAGLGDNAGGLAWAMLQRLIELPENSELLSNSHNFNYICSMNNIGYQKKLEFIRTFGFMFEVHLTEHCNLNCKGCSHFSPLADEEFMDIEVFEKDIARMAQLFGGNDIRMITLLGGEPLLHPQVNDFMKIVIKYFPNIRLQLVTNGLLLPTVNKSFWETCRETGTFIRVSHFPVPLDFSALEEKAQTEGVALFLEPGHTVKSFRRDVYDLAGRQNEQLSHSTCQFFGDCCQLHRGKFYPCTISANFHHFNRYFNLELSLSEDNYIDIYGARSKKDFYQLITAPIPCCRYCNLHAREFGVKWERSKKQISEWT